MGVNLRKVSLSLLLQTMHLTFGNPMKTVFINPYFYIRENSVFLDFPPLNMLPIVFYSR